MKLLSWTQLFKKIIINLLIKPARCHSYLNKQSNQLMMNCFCRMVVRRKAIGLLSSRDNVQRFSRTEIADTRRAGLERTQKLTSGFGEQSCTILLITHHDTHKTEHPQNLKRSLPYGQVLKKTRCDEKENYRILEQMRK